VGSPGARQGAIVLLISDGLERERTDRLAFEMDRLHRSCRRLIWLNPLCAMAASRPRQGHQNDAAAVDNSVRCIFGSSIEGLIKALSSALPPHHFSLIRSAA